MALTMGQKAGWGLCDLSLLTFIMIKQSFVISFLTLFLDVPILLAGWTITSILIFDLLLDGLIGNWSDNTPGRLGRRAPWMLLGTFLMVGGSVAMFQVPEGQSEIQNLFWFSIAFAVATIGFTCINVPYTAMGAEISHSSEDWNGIRGWRVAFATLGLMLGGIFIPYIANDTREGFGLAILMVSPVLFFAPLISVLMTRRAHSVFQPITVSDRGMFKHVYENSAFITLVVVFGLMALAVAIILAGVPFYAAFLFSNDGQHLFSGLLDSLGMISYMFLALVIGSILSQPIWSLLGKALGGLVTLIISILMFIVLEFMIYAILPTSNSLVIGLVLMFSGAVTTAYRQVPWTVYPDLIEATKRKTGLQIEGVFQIAWISGQRIAYAIAPLVLCAILGLSGWQQSVDGFINQTEEAIDALRFTLTLVPGIILMVALVLLTFVYIPLARRELAILAA
ncbi:MAG: MFS transporter [Pseudomonadota bacterium]